MNVIRETVERSEKLQDEVDEIKAIVRHPVKAEPVRWLSRLSRPRPSLRETLRERR